MRRRIGLVDLEEQRLGALARAVRAAPRPSAASRAPAAGATRATATVRISPSPAASRASTKPTGAAAAAPDLARGEAEHRVLPEQAGEFVVGPGPRRNPRGGSPRSPAIAARAAQARSRGSAQEGNAHRGRLSLPDAECASPRSCRSCGSTKPACGLASALAQIERLRLLAAGPWPRRAGRRRRCRRSRPARPIVKLGARPPRRPSSAAEPASTGRCSRGESAQPPASVVTAGP